MNNFTLILQNDL